MRNSRFIGRYGRRRSRRLWRRRRIRQVAGTGVFSLRNILLPILAVEILYGVCHFVTISGYEVSLIRLEEEYQLEWREKDAHENAEPLGHRIEVPDSPADRIYGIRVHPKRLEVEFYRREPVKNRKK